MSRFQRAREDGRSEGKGAPQAEGGNSHQGFQSPGTCVEVGWHVTGFALRRQKSGVERSKAGVGRPLRDYLSASPFLEKKKTQPRQRILIASKLPNPVEYSQRSLSRLSCRIHSKACVLAASAAPGGRRRLRAARPPPSWLKCWWVSQRFLPQAVVSQCPGFLSNSISRTGFRYCYKVSGLLLPAQTSQVPASQGLRIAD